MKLFQVPIVALAVVYAGFAVLTAMAGAFADGGDFWSRLLLVVLHPLCAVGLLILVLTPRLPTARMVGITALLLVTVTADLVMAATIAGGVVKGDWWLPVVFAAVPSMGVVYALLLSLEQRPSRADQGLA